MVKPLTVYKASAGSGKTFTLAVEYIKLLVQNPNSFRTILAVTFTNKATEEMKMRILTHLYGIWKQLPESATYAHLVAESTMLSDKAVRQRAGEALRLLLHNYNYFRVETIDTFFQSVLRNLARELDLTANLRVGLNDVQVEEEAVNQLIDSLSHQDILLKWLLHYIMENISDDRSWNIIGQVKQFGRTIFRDYYKEHSAAINTQLHRKGFLEAYTAQLRQLRSQALDRMTALAAQFFDILDGESLNVDDLSYGRSGVAGFFIKLRDGQLDEGIIGKRVADCMDDASKWCSKKHPRADAIQAVADSQLIPLLRRAVEERPAQWKLYKSADLTLAHLNQLRLLSSIEHKVRQLNEDANRFLLSDTQYLLHSLINDSDSPFIFEKIGTQLEHVMIDEFQDTSTVQWKNFKVLLQECMSHRGSHNLIVGDVKQSIYRWRSGDWRLLNAIGREFPHPDTTLDILPLTVNYRSNRPIIDFNNAFFTLAAQQEYDSLCDSSPSGAEQLRQAYADVSQRQPDTCKADGTVSITLLPQKDYEEQTLNQLALTVEELLSSGEPANSIAILVRTNKHIPLIADYFSQHLPDVPIVSDEAFRLDASPSVCLMIEALHLLPHPDDQLSKATLVKLYQRHVLKNDCAEDELLLKGQSLDDLLPADYVQQRDDLLRLPLYELTERLYSLFQLQVIDDQSAYVCCFYDQLNQFAQDNTIDIDAFVSEWEETISGKTIQGMSSGGIRILSIHKSKGLEFDNVVIPFCDWRLEHSDIIWCQPTEAPFDAIPLVPVDYSAKQMTGTIYERYYLDEHLQNTVDNLNLLYVAFTRAGKNLFVLGRRNATNSRSTLIQNVVTDLTLDGGTLNAPDDKETPLTYTYGTRSQEAPQPSAAVEKPKDAREEKPKDAAQEKPKDATDNVFLQPVEPRHLHIESFAGKTEFRQSNQSRDFIGQSDTAAADSYVTIGNVLHRLFSTIRTTADIAPALQQLQHDGLLYSADVPRRLMEDMLGRILESKQAKDWFSDRWKLYNECTILSLDRQGNMTERRPDRVMTDGQVTHVVDFKFGHPDAEHHRQVQGYIRLLRQMGMPDVHGWLWYVYTNNIEEVKL